MRRLFDVFVSAMALGLLLPICIGIALAVRLDSAGPIFFRQIRVGRGGQPFGILKFRSMVQSAELIGPHFTSTSDPRITRVG